MKILFASATAHNGLHERMTAIVNRYTEHEARCLSPMIWVGRRRFNATFDHEGVVYSIENKRHKNALLEWADVIQFIYTCSLSTLGRRDLLGKKVCAWYLALKWKPAFMEQFPGDDMSRYKLVAPPEGWDRFPRGGTNWHSVPFPIPIEDPLFTPVPWKERKGWISMSPRFSHQNQNEVSAPRKADKVQRKLSGTKFNLIFHQPYETCMALKAQSALGVDDLVQPLIHGSANEYLSLGVPVLNMIDGHIERSIKDTYGCDTIPFLDANLATVRGKVDEFFSRPKAEQERAAIETRAWAEANLHPAKTIKRYMEIYQS